MFASVVCHNSPLPLHDKHQHPPGVKDFCCLSAAADLSSSSSMAKHQYQFCFGPWNISEGQDPYGPPTRPAQSFDWKLAQLKRLGFEAMMFHDDDAVPDIDNKTDAQL